ncbi:hypothetical protein llap_13034 [Limosa lapponica baueri]|uniref:Uncharacterized protein n=1 Tax=Limosa lapponica baueri TaxID=1758121 RepID=A0A2I0TS77_LIMLA|nr:hypothetical protein llap_13034 [Limosa lapponica baueri]
MKRQAEINRFAIFLFCSLVSLGSLAPTATSEGSKTTTGQMQKHFTTQIKPLASVIERQATTLFKKYNVCSSVTPKTLHWLTADSQARDLVKKIPDCRAFAADCCTLHIFHNILQNVRSDIELICGENLTQFVNANINQLNVTLSERAALYTCKDEDLPQMDRSQVQRMKTAEKKTYIWWVLQKYEQFMQHTTKIYSSAEM